MATSKLAEMIDYDFVGHYEQDQVNGLTEDILDRFLQAGDLNASHHVLDAMGGNGNLCGRVQQAFGRDPAACPQLTLLEFSKVQTEIARSRLGSDVSVIQGDLVEGIDLESGELLEGGQYDRILVKSGNHEIPLADQPRLYANLFRLLKPGGLLVNLGFLFDDSRERDELRSIAAVKDNLAGMKGAAVNRHFLTREEFDGLLTKAGFEPLDRSSFDYRIRSDIVSRNYFPEDRASDWDIEHQVAQVRAQTLRRNGRILFDRDCSLMVLPGEITVCRKPAEEFPKFPYDIMRDVRVHRDMLSLVASQIPREARILDVGCGPGLLAERVVQSCSCYTGVDTSEPFIAQAIKRFRGNDHVSFVRCDARDLDGLTGSWNVATLLNVLNLPGIQPVDILRTLAGKLEPGSTLLVAGPKSSSSFEAIEGVIRRQLEEEGVFDRLRDDFEALKKANERILVEHANYWSPEGMVELLRSVGFGEITTVNAEIYESHSYLVGARLTQERSLG